MQGENGYFRLRRGVNNLGIESGTCTWSTPVNTWSTVILERENQDKKRPMTPKVFRNKLWSLILKFANKISDKKSSRMNPKSKRPCSITNRGYTSGSLVLSPEPKNYVNTGELPKAWDWRNIDGINYLSWTVNQHIPQYCGSCWAQATLSALADRFIVADRHKFANLALSAQVILNCRAGGSCEGGAPEQVYEFLHKTGV